MKVSFRDYIKPYLKLINSKKVDKELGKGLSTNDFTNTQKTTIDNVNRNIDFSTVDAASKMTIEYGLYPSHRGSLTANSSNFTDSEGLIISQGTNESSGIKLCGDGITMWNPVDDWHIKILDEDVSGSSYWMINTSGSVVTASDITLKKDFVSQADLDLDTFKSLRVGTWKWKEVSASIARIKALLQKVNSDNHPKIHADLTAKLHRLEKKEDGYGVIAQDAQQLSTLLTQDAAEGKLGINHDYLNYAHIKITQQLLAKIKLLEDEVAQLKQ